MLRFLPYLLFAFFICSCEQEEGCFDEKQNQGESRVDCGGPCDVCPVEYFEFGIIGVNLLAKTDTLFTSDSELSMAATIPNGSSLNTELRLIYGTQWETSNNTNWIINDYTFDRQLFFAPEEGSADLTILKGSDSITDTILVRYFENGAAETRRKIIVWN